MPTSTRIVLAGDVDHGKSTLIGRLLYETGNLAESKLQELEKASQVRGAPREWAFALDALQAERDQAITIETTRVWFSFRGQSFEIIDAPGHREFIRNMLTGASDADYAILVIDAANGVGEQSRRHAFLISMLGISKVIVVVNKMDAVLYDQNRFLKTAKNVADMLQTAGLEAAACIPVSAREGENLVTSSQRMPWFKGPCLMEIAGALARPATRTREHFRMRVQDVLWADGERVAVGRVEAGEISIGESVVILPTKTRATIRAIECWSQQSVRTAHAGQSVGIRFGGIHFVDRGDVLAPEGGLPVLGHRFRASCFWLGEIGPSEGEDFEVHFGPSVVRVVLLRVQDAIDTGSGSAPDTSFGQYSVGTMEFRSRSLISIDAYSNIKSMSRFVLTRGLDVVGCGTVREALDVRSGGRLQGHLIREEERRRRNGHASAVIWLTGLSASGKSTLAMALERYLFDAGCIAYVLDGDNIRAGLNSDLGFSTSDRTENIRRIAELARLLADSGAIVIVACISPMQTDRQMARHIIGAHFHEIFIKADLETCKARDPNGLYKNAAAGRLAEFTGVSAPYQVPAGPHLVVDTNLAPVELSLNELVNYVRNRIWSGDLVASAP